MHLSMLSRHFRLHIKCMYSSSLSDLKKSTAVDESLCKTSTRCSVLENTNQLQEVCNTSILKQASLESRLYEELAFVT